VKLTQKGARNIKRLRLVTAVHQVIGSGKTPWTTRA
jgi:hypothetical protein